ncbi:hypothetical protein MEY_05935, partial [Candida albicans 19F]
TSLSSREMANPRAGSKAKAHSMAMSVTIPEARASTSAHPTRGSRVLGTVNCIGCAQVHHWQHDWYLISSLASWPVQLSANQPEYVAGQPSIWSQD